MKYLKSKLFFNWFVILIIENYNTLSISLYLSYRCAFNENAGYNGEIFSIYVTIINTLVFIIVTILTLVFPFLKNETI